VLCGVLVLTACGGAGGLPRGAGTGQDSGAGVSRSAAPTAARSHGVTKVLVVIEENHSLDQMRAGMPYTFRLAERFGYATDYRALTHPSLPNYLAIVGGSTFGVTDDRPPSAHALSATSVFADALARGRTAAVYADGMTQGCMDHDGGDHYAVRHNPWAYFVRERAVCARFDMAGSALHGDAARGDLPNVGLVIPDTCRDAHDCGLSHADSWFARVMGDVFAGPDWRAGRLAVVLTADEDDHDNQDNKVLTVVVHPSQRHHVVAEPLDHYSLLRLLEDVVGAPHRGQAAGAASMSQAFRLPLR
jgi:phosphatidylinositol-3-phosphatase